MKILFLDIDGVLNCRSTPLRKTFSGFEDFERVDLGCVSLLNQIIAETNAKIVVSSAWRINHSTAELQAFLNHNGLVGEIVGKTEIINYEDARRGDEIQLWLNYNEAESFVILDDGDDMYHLKKYLVQTSFE